MIKKIKRLIRRIVCNEAKSNPEYRIFNEGVLMRVLYFNKLLEMVKDVHGSVVECGVGQGFDL